jgi:hypothetical protein
LLIVTPIAAYAKGGKSGKRGKGGKGRKRVRSYSKGKKNNREDLTKLFTSKFTSV